MAHSDEKTVKKQQRKQGREITRAMRTATKANVAGMSAELYPESVKKKFSKPSLGTRVKSSLGGLKNKLSPSKVNVDALYKKPKPFRSNPMKSSRLTSRPPKRMGEGASLGATMGAGFGKVSKPKLKMPSTRPYSPSKGATLGGSIKPTVRRPSATRKPIGQLGKRTSNISRYR